MRSTVFWSLRGNARTTAPTARATTPPQALETSTSSFHSQALPINFLFLTSHVHHAPDPRKTYARVSPSLGSLAVPRSASIPSLPIITALPARQPKRPGASSTSHLPHTSAVSASHPCRNRDPTVTLGRVFRTLAAIMSTHSCHHALIALVQG